MHPGARIGPYEITVSIGAGGMGEVFRARDTRLNRDVAVKVLPKDFVADADRHRRFEQEAKTLAALNHPNVLIIHDAGMHEGAPYLVSELLEGNTLGEEMNGAALPVRRATEYALQIAHGLAAAHGKGIVHRDLKPENIFVTKDGRVKILDFGLAKLRLPSPRPSPVGREREDAPAATTRMDPEPTLNSTEPGMVLGTPAYMAPEQVRGEPADHRGDIFAFGCVFYEMLSGARAFRRKTPVESMNAVLNEEPRELSAVNLNTPAALQRIVERCLQKQPDDRFQTAKDLAFAIEVAREKSDPALVETRPEASLSRPIRHAAIGITLLLALIAAVWLVASRWFAPLRRPAYRQLATPVGTVHHARFTPDGHTTVYSASLNGRTLEIFLTRSDSPEARSLGLTNADVLAVSSAGELALLLNAEPQGWFISRGTLARMPVAGGTPREWISDVQEADWSPDGKEIAVVRSVERINRLEFPAANGKSLFETPGYISHPRVSPDGHLVAFLEHPSQWDDRGWIAVVDRQGHKRRLTEEWVSLEGLAWAPGGKELWFSASRVGEPWFLQAVTLTGQQRQLTSDVSGLLLQDVSADGQVLVTRTFDFMQHFVRLPGANHEQSLALADQTTPLCFSPDSKHLLLQYWSEGTGSNYVAGMVRVDGSSPVRLGEGRPLAMSPDGQWVAVLLPATEQIELLPTGPGEPKHIQTGPLRCANVQFLPDGKRLVIQCWEKEGQTRFYVQDIEGTNRHAVTSALVRVSFGFLSPDGQYAFARDAQGVERLYPLAGGEPKVVAGVESADQIDGWSADSQSLFVHRNTPFPIQVDRLGLSTGRRTPWKEVAPSDLLGAYEHWILVAPDGETYNYSIARIFCRLYTAQGIK